MKSNSKNVTIPSTKYKYLKKVLYGLIGSFAFLGFLSVINNPANNPFNYFQKYKIKNETVTNTPILSNNIKSSNTPDVDIETKRKCVDDALKYIDRLEQDDYTDTNRYTFHGSSYVKELQTCLIYYTAYQDLFSIWITNITIDDVYTGISKARYYKREDVKGNGDRNNPPTITIEKEEGSMDQIKKTLDKYFF